jgi:hypothetical protein
MRSAFGSAEARALLPVFATCAAKVTAKWTDVLNNSRSGQAEEIDIHPWLNKSTLDAIGIGEYAVAAYL